MGRKKKKEVIVKSVGNSHNDVTGSCFEVSYPKKEGVGKLIIECGMIQENGTILEDYNINKKMVEHIDFKNAEHIFICHSHVDHTGNLMAAIPRGFTGTVITTQANKEISRELLLDTAFIHIKNVKALQGIGKQIKPLYTEQDAHVILDRMKTFEVNEIHKINEYVSFRYVANSHVVGSTSLELFIRKPSGQIIKIFYSSDLGSVVNKKIQPFLSEQQTVTKANISIFESTYGNKEGFTKDEAIQERKSLIKTVKEYTGNGHRVLIPCFSYSRSQTILELLYRNLKDDEKFKDVMVVIDSRLTNAINEVYRRILSDEDREYWNEILSWKNIKRIKEFKETGTFVAKKDIPMVILSSSGMLNAGHSVTWAKSILENKNDCIIFTGFCHPRTIGGKILNEKQKTVTIDGMVYTKKCKIRKFRTFTSHAQKSDLIAYAKQMNCQKILIHHGSQEARDSLKDSMKEELYKIGKTTQVVLIDKKNNCFKL